MEQDSMGPPLMFCRLYLFTLGSNQTSEIFFIFDFRLVEVIIQMAKVS